MPELFVRSQRMVLPDGVRPATVHIRGGRIAAVLNHNAIPPPSGKLLDVGDRVVSPGLVDTHVHVNQPGRTGWEGFRCATRAAAAGGVTTIVDMPLNSVPPTTTVGGLRRKLDSASGRVRVDVGFFGGVIPDHLKHLRPLHAAGVLGFKCFLIDSGVPEFPAISMRQLRPAAAELARLGARLLVHAELRPPVGRTGERTTPDPKQRSSYARYLKSRPESWEVEAARCLIALARETKVAIHIVHLASARALAALRAARREGLFITVETCPHYLSAAAEEIEDGATLWKCAPPIRSSVHREALWQGLIAGDIDLIVSDHSPSPPKLKCLSDGDFMAAWGGISSLQLGLSLVWTAARQRNLGLDRLAAWMSAGPARLAGLAHKKGRIAAGLDADLVIWDPEAEFCVSEDSLFSRHRLTPYLGRALAGKVDRTLLRGEVVYVNGQFPGHPRGKLVLIPGTRPRSQSTARSRSS